MSSASGKALLRKRGEHLERGFCHVLDHGGLRRATLRGTEKLSKRLIIAALTHNLSLLLRQQNGIGTAKQALAAAAGFIWGLLAAFLAAWSRCWSRICAVMQTGTHAIRAGGGTCSHALSLSTLVFQQSANTSARCFTHSGFGVARQNFGFLIDAVFMPFPAIVKPSMFFVGWPIPKDF